MATAVQRARKAHTHTHTHVRWGTNFRKEKTTCDSNSNIMNENKIIIIIINTLVSGRRGEVRATIMPRRGDGWEFIVSVTLNLFVQRWFTSHAQFYMEFRLVPVFAPFSLFPIEPLPPPPPPPPPLLLEAQLGQIFFLAAGSPFHSLSVYTKRYAVHPVSDFFAPSSREKISFLSAGGFSVLFVS